MFHAHSPFPDRLATVSSNDSTPDTLKNKITSTGGSLAITEVNDGGNETLNIEAAVVASAMVAHGYVRVTGNNAAKTYLDTRDWRGRGLEIWSAAQQGNAAFVETVGTWSTGWSFQGQIAGSTYAGADIQLVLSGAGGNIRVFIETGTGKLYVTSDAFVAEFQFKYLVVGRPTDAAATLTL